MGLPITSDPVTCAFVELAGKSKQDTAPRKLVLSPAEMGEPPSAKDSGLKSGGRRNILMPCRSISMEASMRSISFSVTALLALLSWAALAQQPPTTGDTIGHPPQMPGPPPIAGPPPISEPSPTMQPAPAASTPRASEPAPKGNTYVPATLPQANTGPGLNVPGRLYKNGESGPVQHSRSRD